MARFARIYSGFPPVLPFLCFFLKKGKENNQKDKDFLSLPNPKNPWKKWKNAQKKKEIIAGEKKNKEFQKKQGKEGQGLT